MRYYFLLLSLFTSSLLFAVKPAKKDSLDYPIRKITFDNAFRTDTTAIDTTCNNLHILIPAYQNEHSYVKLVRIGYPMESNNIVSRLSYSDYFYQANSFLPIIQDSRNNFFYDTRKQFTSFKYKNVGFSTTEKEEYLQVLHTQNLTQRSNLGLYYNLYSSFSQNNQKSTDHSLNIFYRYSGEKYLGYTQFYFNSFSLWENGGIVADSLVDYSKGSLGYNGLETNLKSGRSYFRRVGLNTIHELKLKGLFVSDDDSTARSSKDFGSIIYNLNIESNKRSYTDNFSDSLMYRNNYSKSVNPNDSVTMSKISNKIMLNSPLLLKYLPNLRLSLTNDLYFSNISIPRDTIAVGTAGLISKTITMVTPIRNNEGFRQNTYSTIDVTQNFSHFLLNVVWNSYFLGYNIGDQKLQAIAKVYVDTTKKYSLTIKAQQEISSPSFLYSQFYSNHLFWKPTVFNKQKMLIWSGILSSLKPNITVSADYIILNNYLHFNKDSVPTQSSATDNFLALSIKSELGFWKIVNINSCTYQVSSTGNYLKVPRFQIYNSTNFWHIFHFYTGGRLYTQLGVDIYYTSSYKPDAYSPVIGVFYTQNRVTTGDYPMIDFHLTFKVKTVSFFIKYSHANAGLSGYNHSFDALHYPTLPAMFSFGINWLFYD